MDAEELDTQAPRILVTGAAGKTGRSLLRALARRGAPARALVRRATQEAVVRGAGAREAVVADLRDGEALARAADGVRAIYHICPNVSPHEVEIGRAVIDAALRAGVERLVYHSVLHPQTEAMPHHWRKLRVEELLLASGLAFTVLRPAAYMQNVLAHWPSIVERGVFPVPYGVDSRIALVDLEDVAEVAAAVLTEAGHHGAGYELCAESPSQTEVAATLSAVLERPVRAVDVGLDAWRRGAADLDADRRGTLTAMFRYYDRHGLAGNANVLSWLLGREPTSFEAFAARARRQGPGRDA